MPLLTLRRVNEFGCVFEDPNKPAEVAGADAPKELRDAPAADKKED